MNDEITAWGDGDTEDYVGPSDPAAMTFSLHASRIQTRLVAYVYLGTEIVFIVHGYQDAWPGGLADFGNMAFRRFSQKLATAIIAGHQHHSSYQED